jgi:hypothetical protein
MDVGKAIGPITGPSTRLNVIEARYGNKALMKRLFFPWCIARSQLVLKSQWNGFSIHARSFTEQTFFPRSQNSIKKHVMLN